MRRRAVEPRELHHLVDPPRAVVCVLREWKNLMTPENDGKRPLAMSRSQASVIGNFRSATVFPTVTFT